MQRPRLSSILFAIGALLVLLSAGTLACVRWVELTHAQQALGEAVEPLPERLDVSDPLPAEVASAPPVTAQDEVSTSPAVAAADPLLPATDGVGSALPNPYSIAQAPAPTAERTAVPTATRRPPTATAMPASTSTPQPTPVPGYGRPVAMQIPRIGLKRNVMALGVRGGEYEVPAWDVGFHADSAEPGRPGNSVFNGHLETIDAGRVFARLKELREGDAVYVYTATHRLSWVVREAITVPNTDHEFIQPTDDVRITLYTCAGTYNPLARDYTHRQVVVARLVEVEARGS
jgi:LPXTG-site transpeptidase (sortase) family protein